MEDVTPVVRSSKEKNHLFEVDSFVYPGIAVLRDLTITLPVGNIVSGLHILV